MTDRRPILIAGPTASGKSAIALALAERYDGVIVNADSMQVYHELRILTARPSEAEEAQAPHRLYGHVPAAEAYSVARYVEDIAGALAEAAQRAWRPVIVGGTGLYFKALLEGLSPIPAIPDAVRQHWRTFAADAAPGVLHAELAARDPAMAHRLAPGDTQRLTRALEVVDATGRSLGEWQATPGPPLIQEADCIRLVVAVPRAELHARANQRFDTMIAGGAVDEVRAVLSLGLPPEQPAMRALGVAALAEHLAGRVTLHDAVERAKAETRQYIKRQETWLRRYMNTWNIVHTHYNCEFMHDIFRIIDD